MAPVLRSLSAAAALGLAIVASAAPAGAASLCDGVSGNLLANCGFETSVRGSIPSWSQSGGGAAFSLLDSESHSGTRDAYMNADSGTQVTLSQTVGGPGVYDVSFYLNAYNAGVLTRQVFSVTFGGQTLMNVDRNPLMPAPPGSSQGYIGWTLYSFDDVTTTGPATLSFTFFNNLAQYPNIQMADLVIDDTVVTLVSSLQEPPTAVPEPATLLLFGAGLLGLATTRRGRRAGV